MLILLQQTMCPKLCFCDLPLILTDAVSMFIVIIGGMKVVEQVAEWEILPNP